jgi:biopolymer transport protein ExbD
MFIGNTRHKEGEIPTASLADIVFLLLIFFLVTTSIDIQKGIGIVLPGFEPFDVSPKMLTNVWINKEGTISVDGKITALNQLSPEIKTRLIHNPKLIVSLTTTAETDYDIYIKVLDRLKQAWGNQPARISIAEPFKN